MHETARLHVVAAPRLSFLTDTSRLECEVPRRPCGGPPLAAHVDEEAGSKDRCHWLHAKERKKIK